MHVDAARLGTAQCKQRVAHAHRQRLATADFCAAGCTNELVVWRVTREGVVKELAWRSTDDWADATPRWKDADTVVVEYRTASGGAPQTLERKLSQGGWLSPR